MSKKNIAFQNDSLNEISDMFYRLLEKSENDLNQTVGNNSFVIPVGIEDSFADDLSAFLKLVQKEYKKDEKILELFDNLGKDTDSEKFVIMLKHYIEAVNQPAKETAFLRDMPLDEFKSMVEYCYSNFVISNGDIERDEGMWEQRQLQVLRKVILTVSEMVVLAYYPEHRVLYQINRMFNLNEEYGKILWNMVQGDKDQLWKYMMSARCDHIESKLDLILDLVQGSR